MTIDKALLGDVEAEDLDTLYADLAIAQAGTDPEIAHALRGVASVRAMVAGEASVASFGNPIGWLIHKGKEIFNRHWPDVRAAVCKAYEEHGEDWVKKAAEAISSLLGLAGAVVAIILKIAIKLGMGFLCSTEAPAQPA